MFFLELKIANTEQDVVFNSVTFQNKFVIYLFYFFTFFYQI